MKVEVKLFALAKQLARCDTIQVDLPPGADVADLRRAIGQHFPDLAQLVRHALFAVNAEYADEDSPLPGGAEIACIPPVSGG
jgi:molybdopterin converting factor small subunit